MLKNMEEGYPDELNLDLEETPQPIKITSFPPSGFSTSRVEPSYKDIKISSVYGKAKATFAEDEKQTIDERIKSKLTHLPHMYSKNKLMIKKRHKLRETIGTFDFKNRRKSDLDIYDKYNSLERNLRTPIMSLHDEESKFPAEEFWWEHNLLI